MIGGILADVIRPSVGCKDKALCRGCGARAPGLDVWSVTRFGIRCTEAYSCLCTWFNLCTRCSTCELLPCEFQVILTEYSVSLNQTFKYYVVIICRSFLWVLYIECTSMNLKWHDLFLDEVEMFIAKVVYAYRPNMCYSSSLLSFEYWIGVIIGPLMLINILAGQIRRARSGGIRRTSRPWWFLWNACGELCSNHEWRWLLYGAKLFHFLSKFLTASSGRHALKVL